MLAVAVRARRAAGRRPPRSIDVRAQLPEPARKAWDAAKQLAGASDYRGALVEFQRAYELSHNPRVLFNVGVTEKLLTHYARAVDAWDKEQTEGAAQLTPAELQELKNAIAIVQQFVTTIDVDRERGRRDARRSTTTRWARPRSSGPVRIDVGKHVLKLSKEGFVDAVQPVDVASGARTPVTLQARAAEQDGARRGDRRRRPDGDGLRRRTGHGPGARSRAS